MAQERTVADLIRHARGLLQDKEDLPYRYPDADLIDSLNQAMREVYRVRPDGFIKLKFDIPLFTATTDVFPIADYFFNPVVYYCVGYTQLRDDEFANDGRALGTIQKATGTLLTPAS